MIKYLFSDLDGTLMLEKDLSIPSTKIPQHNLAAIKKFTNNGNYFGIATGRPLGNVLKLIIENNLNDLCVCENGMIVSYNHELIIKGELHLQELKKIIAYAKEKKIEFLGFYGDNNIAFFNDNVVNESTQIRKKKYKNTYKYISTQKLDFTKIIHLTLLFSNWETKNKHINIMNKMLKHTKIIATMHDAADFVNINTSKLNAILKFKQLNNLKDDQIGYVGDGFNDLECLNYFKNSFVMKNSTPELLSNLKKEYTLVDDVAQAIKIFTGE